MKPRRSWTACSPTWSRPSPPRVALDRMPARRSAMPRANAFSFGIYDALGPPLLECFTMLARLCRRDHAFCSTQAEVLVLGEPPTTLGGVLVQNAGIRLYLASRGADHRRHDLRQPPGRRCDPAADAPFVLRRAERSPPTTWTISDVPRRRSGSTDRWSIIWRPRRACCRAC